MVDYFDEINDIAFLVLVTGDNVGGLIDLLLARCAAAAE